VLTLRREKKLRMKRIASKVHASSSNFIIVKMKPRKKLKLFLFSHSIAFQEVLNKIKIVMRLPSLVEKIANLFN
jgi:hypothetical protein